jgi:accessory gene regulator protein AgrB|tara:strand:+ start:690 stop:1061 length:372 start_codon:yes stop_codon:yes gene_type:complete
VKYVYLFTNSVWLLAALFMFIGMSDPEDWVAYVISLGYVLLPFIIPLYASFRYLRGTSDKPTWSIAGVVAGFLACVLYAGTYMYADANEYLDLILTVAPGYQIMGLIAAGAAAHFVVSTKMLD